MPKKIASKIKKETLIKCRKCGDEIFGDTKKKMTYCKCESIAVDGCEYYIRLIGDEENYEIIDKKNRKESFSSFEKGVPGLGRGNQRDIKAVGVCL